MANTVLEEYRSGNYDFRAAVLGQRDAEGHRRFDCSKPRRGLQKDLLFSLPGFNTIDDTYQGRLTRPPQAAAALLPQPERVLSEALQAMEEQLQGPAAVLRGSLRQPPPSPPARQAPRCPAGSQLRC